MNITIKADTLHFTELSLEECENKTITIILVDGRLRVNMTTLSKISAAALGAALTHWASK